MVLVPILFFHRALAPAVRQGVVMLVMMVMTPVMAEGTQQEAVPPRQQQTLAILPAITPTAPQRRQVVPLVPQLVVAPQTALPVGAMTLVVTSPAAVLT